jgi:transposase
MRENDGRKLDHKTLEVLRIRAVDQAGEGAHPEDVAAALGLHRKTVYGWLAKYREGGKDALLARPVPGRPTKLAGPQISRLYSLIVGQDPRRPSTALPWSFRLLVELRCLDGGDGHVHRLRADAGEVVQYLPALGIGQGCDPQGHGPGLASADQVGRRRRPCRHVAARHWSSPLKLGVDVLADGRWRGSR